MTNAEAIEILREKINEEFSADTAEAFCMAISALEKQEGKKPRTMRTDYDKYGEYCVNYYCPCCNRRIISRDSAGWFGGKPVMYCECGQKILWEE